MSQISQIKKIYHAAIYVRLSKEDGAVASHEKTESNSIANQKSLIRDFLENKNDIEVVQEYVDDGFSGSNFERPAFQMMLEDIKKGKIDCVVTKDLSRFGREYIDSGMYIERLFPAMGVRFIAINDGIDSGEAKSQSDEIIIPFKNLINDAYCRDISICNGYKNITGQRGSLSAVRGSYLWRLWDSHGKKNFKSGWQNLCLLSVCNP